MATSKGTMKTISQREPSNRAAHTRNSDVRAPLRRGALRTGAEDTTAMRRLASGGPSLAATVRTLTGPQGNPLHGVAAAFACQELQLNAQAADPRPAACVQATFGVRPFGFRRASSSMRNQSASPRPIWRELHGLRCRRLVLGGVRARPQSLKKEKFRRAVEWMSHATGLRMWLSTDGS